MTEHECAHPRCHKPLDVSLFACGYHWRTLPTPIKNEINRAYSRYSRGTVDLDVLRDAQQLALDWWAQT